MENETEHEHENGKEKTKLKKEIQREKRKRKRKKKEKNNRVPGAVNEGHCMCVELYVGRTKPYREKLRLKSQAIKESNSERRLTSLGQNRA